MIRLQSEPLEIAELIIALGAGDKRAGAVASFVGRVRGDDGLHALTLEHYPGMTEKALAAIEAEARARAPILDLVLVHRTGRMEAGEAIVFVGAVSAHRRDAIEATHYVMDQVKVRGPFWKKEHRAEGERWVEARPNDEEAARKWQR